MFDLRTFKQKSPQQRFLLILGLVMFVFYFVLGVLLIVRKDMMTQFPDYARYLLGGVLIVYAAIRFYRVTRPNDE